MFEGVKSSNPLLPMLTPPEVVSRTIKAIKTNQEEVFIPGILRSSIIPFPFILCILLLLTLPILFCSLLFSLLYYQTPSILDIVRLTYLMRFLAPPFVRDIFTVLLGVSRSMDDFAGLRRIH